MELPYAPNSNVWLMNRWRYLGSSDFPIAIGLSAYAMPWDLLNYKRKGEDAEPTEQTEQMRLGHVNEEPIAAAIAAKMGWELELGKQYQSDYHASTIDRWIKRPVFTDWEILEIKYKNYKLPPTMPDIMHVAQVHHQMFVTSRPHAYIAYGRPEEDSYKMFKIAFNQFWWRDFAEPRMNEFRARWVGQEGPLSYSNEYERWGPMTVRRVFAPELIRFPAPKQSTKKRKPAQSPNPWKKKRSSA